MRQESCRRKYRRGDTWSFDSGQFLSIECVLVTLTIYIMIFITIYSFDVFVRIPKRFKVKYVKE